MHRRFRARRWPVAAIALAVAGILFGVAMARLDPAALETALSKAAAQRILTP